MIKLNKIVEDIEQDSLKLKISELVKSIEKIYPNQIEDLFIHLQQHDVLFIDSIKIKQEYRNQGIGSKIMDIIIKFADNNNLNITLSPESEKGYKKKLENWYKSLGFYWNTGRKKDYRLSSFFGPTMLRRPNKY